MGAGCLEGNSKSAKTTEPRYRSPGLKAKQSKTTEPGWRSPGLKVKQSKISIQKMEYDLKQIDDDLMNQSKKKENNYRKLQEMTNQSEKERIIKSIAQQETTIENLNKERSRILQQKEIFEQTHHLMVADQLSKKRNFDTTSMRINAEDNNKKYQNDKMNLDEAENIYNNRGPTKQSQREKELREKYLRAPA